MHCVVPAMADAASEDGSERVGPPRPPPPFGGTIFLQQGAHVTVLDGRGRIITVNDAWNRFGRENGLDPAYQFLGASYPEACERALHNKFSNEGARAAVDGLKKVLAAREQRFSLIYPCHAPHAQRWFLMFARPIAAETDGAVVSHVDVTSLHVAGLVPDETTPPTGAPPSPRDADELARLLFTDAAVPLASLRPRLR